MIIEKNYYHNNIDIYKHNVKKKKKKRSSTKSENGYIKKNVMKYTYIYVIEKITMRK